MDGTLRFISRWKELRDVYPVNDAQCEHLFKALSKLVGGTDVDTCVASLREVDPKELCLVPLFKELAKAYKTASE